MDDAAWQLDADALGAELGEALDRVEHGEAVVIVRQGRAVARLIKASADGDRADAVAAAEALAALRRDIAAEAGAPFSIGEILALRDEGRRG